MAKTKTKTRAKAKTTSRRRVKEEPIDNRKKAQELLANIRSSWAQLAPIISEVYETQEWMQWKYDKWADCGEQEWGLSYRDLQWQLQMGDAIRKHNIPLDKLVGIPWTKFRDITAFFDPEMTKTQINNLISQTKKLKGEEFERFKQTLRTGTEGGEPSKTVTMIFKFKNEAADVVIEALTDCKEIIQIEHDDVAAEYIFSEWSQSHKKKPQKAILDGLKSDIEEEEEEEGGKKATRKKRSDSGKSRKAKEEEEEEEEEEVEEEDEDLDTDDFEDDLEEEEE